jgi:hypothetical protein
MHIRNPGLITKQKLGVLDVTKNTKLQQAILDFGVDKIGLVEVLAEANLIERELANYKRALIECAIDLQMQEGYRNHPDAKTIDDWFEIGQKYEQNSPS